MAKDSQVLDLNSSYSYLLWCRDFADTSILATVDDQPAGFITGYLRPDEPGTLMVWQVAVDESFRGRRLAGSMLDRLARQTGARRVETTITDDNQASIRLFTGFAARRSADLEREPLFTRDQYPDTHDTEFLFRIGPLN
ncbi:diaminobutyrate acetyltransferase [Arthrobacter crystallopoietes]|uniref:diaminobutyrate acetyltransferase n=1 Tax=Crystallibacter crystallopoietes TaxID=37928 RepID=UPI003D256464